jgi:hypothetical protein
MKDRRSQILMGLLGLSLFSLTACSASIASNGLASTTGPSSSGGTDTGTADRASKAVGPTVPSSAVVVGGIQSMGNWVSDHDEVTGGTSTGATVMAGTPSLSGKARQFYTTYTNYGGHRYYAFFGADATSKNFVYDGWIYLDESSGSIGNLELDMNQVLPNGDTVIYGIQCDSWSGTWDYTENAGTPTAFHDEWVHSSAPCNATTWTRYAWHHVQFSYSRDDYGNVTYKSIWLDGNQQQINATVPSAFTLGWAPTLLTNFQVDSHDAPWSSSNIYLDNLTVSRW